MNSAIQVRGLKKSYGSHIVFNGLDFQIEKGEIYALLGVNASPAVGSSRKIISGLPISARARCNRLFCLCLVI